MIDDLLGTQIGALYGTLTMRASVVERACDIQKCLPDWALRSIRTQRNPDVVQALYDLAPITAVDSPPGLLAGVTASAEAALTVARVLKVRLPPEAGVESHRAVDDLIVLFAAEWEAYTAAAELCDHRGGGAEPDWVAVVDQLHLRAAFFLHPAALLELRRMYGDGIRLLRRIRNAEQSAPVLGLTPEQAEVAAASQEAIIILTDIPDTVPDDMLG